jgi:hypothetical protein
VFGPQAEDETDGNAERVSRMQRRRYQRQLGELGRVRGGAIMLVSVPMYKRFIRQAVQLSNSLKPAPVLNMVDGEIKDIVLGAPTTR